MRPQVQVEAGEAYRNLLETGRYEEPVDPLEDLSQYYVGLRELP